MTAEPGLHVSPDLILPLDAVTQTFGLLAKRGAGKTNAAVVIAEEMIDAGLPWVALDPVGAWWGIRAAGDGGPGLPVIVLGGEHGDLPLDPGSGQFVADLVIDHESTMPWVVLDMTEMNDSEIRRFVTAFVRQLFRRNRTPRHLFFEEADVILPQQVQSGDAAMVGAVTKLIKLGRGKGLGATLITQRSASVNKNGLTQVETLIPLRTTSPQDRAAILAWVKEHEAGAGAVAELPTLADGEAYVFSPHWLGQLTRIKFRRRRTFDSGATPEMGQQIRPAVNLADVDLGAIKEAMAATIEKAQADDPKVLRARVRQLEMQLAQRRAEPATVEVPVEVRVEVPVLDDDTRQMISDLATRLATIADRPPPAAPVEIRPAPTRAPAAVQPTRISRLGPPPDGPVHLRTGARRMVEALGRMHPLRLTTSQWGTLARLKTTGGTWSTYLSDIRRAGYIDEDPSGYTLTDAGFDYLAGRPEPMTPGELQDHYRGILRTGAAKMLDALIDAYPGSLTRDELGAAADISTAGGTFSTYLSDLTRNGLAEKDNGSIRATPILMGDTQ